MPKFPRGKWFHQNERVKTLFPQEKEESPAAREGSRRAIEAALTERYRADKKSPAPKVKEVSPSRVVFEHEGRIMAAKYDVSGAKATLGPSYVVKSLFIPDRGAKTQG